MVSMVSVIAAVMVDAIVTGQFLGSDAVASMGLVQPVVMICNVFGTLFGPGLMIVCTRYMGMAKLDQVVQTFSIVMITMISAALAAAFALFILAPVLAELLGSKTNDTGIVMMISDYLRGYAFGLPFFLLSMALSGLMILDNDRNLGVISILVTLFADAIFDLLNVLVFHGGMRGMAIATSCSTFLGALTLLTHFLKKERILRFKLSGLHFSYLKETILNSVPNAINSGSSAVRNLFFNVMLLTIATKSEVSALSVTNSTFSIIIAVTIAFNISTSAISSLFYGEEDKKGIEVAFKQSAKTILAIFAVITIIIVVFANNVVRLFLKSGDALELSTAAFFIRCMIVQYFLMCISYSFTGTYQGIKHLKLNYIMVILRETAFPVICVYILGKLFGIRGVGAGFVTAGFFSLLLCFFLPAVIKRKIPVKAGDYILIDDDFGSKPEDTFETSVSDMEGVIDASIRVSVFYKEHGSDSRTTFHVSLFLEEMLRNIIEYGYKDNREKCIDIRVIHTENRQVIRIRDNGVPFDPLEWYKRNNPEDPASGFGIRMVMALAKDVRYVPTMELNNLMLIL